MLKSIPKVKFIWLFTTVFGLLLIPLIAMQFTDQVNWSPLDFLIMAILLTVSGTAILLLKQSRYRVHWIIAIVVLFLLIWAELAVGILGTPWAGS